MSDPLLEINKLTVDYEFAGRQMRALDQISFTIQRGQVLGVAGESGCGKSTLGLSIIRLLPKIAKIKGGEILFRGRDLLRLSEEQMDREIRGKEISMVFQNPQNALNPVFKIGTQMIDVLFYQSEYQNVGRRKTRAEIRQQVIAKLRETGIADPTERISNYPFEFSGGMKQRVMIAMALSSETSLLIADEPTTALDVTIEAQILELIRDMYTKYKTSVLYISHDLGVLSEISDRIMIMYAGRIFEMGQTKVVLQEPRHPYSAALLESLPGTQIQRNRLLSIPDFVPPLDRLPLGCSFHPRCRFSEKICREQLPPLVEVASDHWSACFLAQGKGMQKWKWV
jgi:oligopeptide/dipeptide ABC transporter ATP-binding protein